MSEIRNLIKKAFFTIGGAAAFLYGLTLLSEIGMNIVHFNVYRLPLAIVATGSIFLALLIHFYG